MQWYSHKERGSLCKLFHLPSFVLAFVRLIESPAPTSSSCTSRHVANTATTPPPSSPSDEDIAAGGCRRKCRATESPDPCSLATLVYRASFYCFLRCLCLLRAGVLWFFSVWRTPRTCVVLSERAPVSCFAFISSPAAAWRLGFLILGFFCQPAARFTSGFRV